MITLDSATDEIRVEMSGAPATTQPDFKTSWDDNDDSASLFTFGETNGVLNGTTPVTIIPSPAADVQRNGKRINVYNRDTAAVTLTFSFYDGTNTRFLGRFVLEPNGSVAWESCSGWTVYDATGAPAAGMPAAHAITHEDGGVDEISVAGLSGELADDQPPKAHDIEGAKHTLSGAAAGEVMAANSATTFAFQSRIFSKSGVFFHGGDNDVTVWRAPFACTVTNVRGYRKGGSAAAINARKNGTSEHLASDLSLTSANTWMDGGSVQNTAYAAGDSLEFRRKSASGKPVITIQVDFTRP